MKTDSKKTDSRNLNMKIDSLLEIFLGAAPVVHFPGCNILA